MLQSAAILLGFLLLATIVAAASESDYRKYLRTRPPRLPGEVHVEEVLEVFKTNSRPSPYGVYNMEVNAFLANEFLRKQKRVSTTTTSTTTPAPVRTTYPSSSKDNTNPDYRDLFRPTLSMTKYPNYVPPKGMIIIKEAAPTESYRKPGYVAKAADPVQAEDFQYSNEDDYLEP